MGMRTADTIYQWVVGLILLVLALTMVLPFVYIILVSFTDASVYSSGKLLLWPREWSLDAYQLIFSGNGFTRALNASLFITLLGTPIAILISSMLAYMLSKSQVPGRKIMLNLIVFTLLFQPGLIPNYLVVKELGLLNSWWAIILPATANAWNLLVMKSFFQGIHKEIEEAARLDGCHDIRIFFQIILPLSKAMLAAFTLFTAVMYWNTYFNAIVYLNSAKLWPLQVFLQQVVMSSNTSEFLNMGLVVSGGSTVPTEILKMAAVVVVTLPILVVYPFLQKYFAKGVMIGSVKG